MTDNYPEWTCSECAEKAGGRFPENTVSAWHIGECQVCNEQQAVTQPRAFRYPIFVKGQFKK